MTSTTQYFYAWGSNETQFFSIDTTKKVLLPKKIKLQLSIETIACTEKDVVILNKQGYVYRFVNQSVKIIKGLENIIKITNGQQHFLALDAYGNAYSWGNGECGCLGNENFKFSEIPQPVLIKEKISDIFCGKYTSFFITNSNQVYGCGSNKVGELGIKIQKYYFNPTRIDLGELMIRQIAGGFQHTLFLSTNGDIYATGSGKNGRLGIRSTIDYITKIQKVQTKQKFKKIASSNYSAAINDKGYIYVWGNSIFGTFKEPSLLYKNKIFNEIFLKKDIGFAIAQDDQVWVWGKNQSGELGVGDTQPRPKPCHLNILQNKCMSLFIGSNISFCILVDDIKLKQRSINLVTNQNSLKKVMDQKQIKTVRSKQNNRKILQLPQFQRSEVFGKGILTCRENQYSAPQSLCYDNQTQKTQKNKNNILQKQLTQNIEEIKNLKQKIMELTNEKQNACKTIIEKQNILQSIKEKVITLEEMIIEKNKCDIEKKQMMIREQYDLKQKIYINQVQQLNQKVTIFIQENNKKERYIQELRNKKNKKETEVQQLKTQKKEQEITLENFIRNEKMLKEEIQANKNRQSKHLTDIQKLTFQLSQLKQQKQLLMKNEKTLNQKVELGNHKINSLQSIISQLKNEQEKYILELQKNNKQWKHSLDITKNSQKQIKNQLQKTKSYLNSLQQKYQLMSKKFTQNENKLSNELNQFQSKNELLEKEVIELNKKLVQLGIRKEAERVQEVTKLKQINSKLENRIQKFKARESKNLTEIKRLAQTNNRLVLSNTQQHIEQIQLIKDQMRNMQNKHKQLLLTIQKKSSEVSLEINQKLKLNQQILKLNQQIGKLSDQKTKEIKQKNQQIKKIYQKYQSTLKVVDQKNIKLQQLTNNILNIVNQNRSRENMEIQSLKNNCQLLENLLNQKQFKIKNQNILIEEMKRASDDILAKEKRHFIQSEQIFKKELNLKEQKINNLQTQLLNIRNENEGHIKQKTQVWQRYHSFIDELKNKQKIINQTNHQLIGFTTYKKDVQQQLIKYQKKVECFEYTIKDKDTKIKQLNTQLSNKINQSKTRQINDFRRYREKSQGLQQSIKQKDIQLLQLKQKLFEISNTLANESNTNVTLKQDNSILLQTLNEREHLIKILSQEKNMIAHNARQQENTEIKKLTSRCKSLEEILQQKQFVIDQLNKDLSIEIRRRKFGQSDNLELKNKYNQVKGTLRNKEDQIQEMNQKLLNQINNFTLIEKQPSEFDQLHPKVSEFDHEYKNDVKTRENPIMINQFTFLTNEKTQNSISKIKPFKMNSNNSTEKFVITLDS